MQCVLCGAGLPCIMRGGKVLCVECAAIPVAVYRGDGVEVTCVKGPADGMRRLAEEHVLRLGYCVASVDKPLTSYHFDYDLQLLIYDG